MENNYLYSISEIQGHVTLLIITTKTIYGPNQPLFNDYKQRHEKLDVRKIEALILIKETQNGGYEELANDLKFFRLLNGIPLNKFTWKNYPPPIPQKKSLLVRLWQWLFKILKRK